MPHGAPVTRNFCHPPQHSEGHLIFKNQKLFAIIEFHCFFSPPLRGTWRSQHSSEGFPLLSGSVIPAMSSSRNVFPFTPTWPGSVKPFKGLTNTTSPSELSCPCFIQPSRSSAARSLLLWMPFSLCLVLYNPGLSFRAL